MKISSLLNIAIDYKIPILKLHKSSKEPFDDIADDDTRLDSISEV